jgi:putative hydrolase of the HAD superfamily
VIWRERLLALLLDLDGAPVAGGARKAWAAVVVINSSVIGVHKPTTEFFATACRAVRRAPALCLFVDDTDRHVRGARVAGLSAYRWNGAADLPYIRAAIGL